MSRPDPIVFTRRYLDQFGSENWDGKGIMSATVLTAKWDSDIVQGKVTDVVRATVRLHDGKTERLDCWPDNPPEVGRGHIFPRLAEIAKHNLANPLKRIPYFEEDEQ